MFSFLKNHPFAVETHFDYSITLTFAVPKTELQHLIPECLSLDTYDNWAFIAVALVQTKDLRPKGFPAFMGNDFFLMGYRLFVRYTTSKGKKLRGLYILKSETNSKKKEIGGNIFTHYKFSTTDINSKVVNGFRDVSSEKSDFHFRYNIDPESASLPVGSPFDDWHEARKFSGPLPFTFTLNANRDKVLIVEGVRQNWKPKPLHIVDYNFPFLEQLNIRKPILANAFIINDIPYYWKKGTQDSWLQ
jgi:hypothetical protein